jgi:hypothetical protein
MQKEVKVLNGQSIFDIALYCYNDATLVYNLINENSIITDINMNLTGLNLVYTPIEIIKYEAKENPNKVNKVVTIKKEQSLFDLSLQYYGNVENVYDLIQSNSYLDSILTDNFNANVLNYTSEVNYVNSYFSKNLIDIATKPNGITIEGSNYLLQEDGSYLLQENGFKIIL